MAPGFPPGSSTTVVLRPDLPRLLGQLRELTTDALAIDRVMRLERDELGGNSIAAALDLPDQSRLAWVILQQLGT